MVENQPTMGDQRQLTLPLSNPVIASLNAEERELVLKLVAVLFLEAAGLDTEELADDDA